MSGSRVALGYGRKSVVRRKSDEIGVDKQKLAIERLAGELDYDLTWYADAKGHRSGRWERTRPDYLRLLRRLEEDAGVAAVIFFELDRAGRSVVIIDRIVKLCQQKGIRLISIRDGIDTSRGIDANVTSQIQMRAVFAEYYSNQVSDLMRQTSTYYRDEMLSPWGMWPFGMTRSGEGKDARFAPHPTHGATVRTLLTWYAGGMSYEAVAQAANDHQLRHEARDHTPKRFTREAIRSIVGNVLFYSGYAITGRRFRSKDSRILLEGEGPEAGTYLQRYAAALHAQRSPAIEPLVDEAQACAVIERRYKNQLAGRKPCDWVALLSPLAYWGDRKLRADTKAGWHYYHPRGRGPWIDGDRADADLVDHLSGIGFPPELRALIRARVAERVGDDRKRKAAADLADYQRRMEVLQDLLLDRKIERDAYNRRYTELERAARDARAELAREDDVDRLMASLTDLGGAIAAMRQVNRKRAIGHLFDRVEFDDAGAIRRLHMKDWALRAWGEIVFAYRLYANSAPGEQSPQSWPENIAWLAERTA